MAAELPVIPIEIQFKPRWWLRHYVFAVFLFAEVFDCEVNEERFIYWFKRGYKVRYSVCGHWYRVQ